MFEDVLSFVNGFMKNFDSPYMLLMKITLQVEIEANVHLKNPVVILQNCYLQNPTFWLYLRDKFAISLQQQQCGSKYCLRKTILCLQVIYFLFVFCANLVFPLLLCVIFAIVATVSAFLSCSSHLFGYHKKNLQFLPKNSG